MGLWKNANCFSQSFFYDFLDSELQPVCHLER